MTLVRKLALKISDVVVKYSSPGCKEWAEGLLQETVFIDSDMSALGWSLGSTRVLLDRREAPIGSVADIHSVAQKYVESKLSGADTCILMLIQGLLYAWKFFGARSWTEHCGCVLAALSAFSLGVCSLLERRRINALLSSDIDDNVLFYKSELERGLQRSSRWFITVSSFLLYGVGVMLAQRGGVRGNPVFSALIGLFFVAVIPLLLRTRQVNRRRLERLDELLTKGS